MTTANNVVAKLSVAFVTVAMLFTFVAPTQAATEDELQKMVNDLLAQIAALKGTTTVSGSAYVFTRPLTIGSTGADVTALQTYLISKGFSIPAGATGYFGAQTQAAVAAWQAANGVTPAAGYFGPVSQAKYNALMASNPSTPTTPDNNDLEGEASLGDTDLQDGEDTDIEEGQEAAPVAELEVEFEDGDAEINRIDITLVGSGDEQDPWDTFEEVSLWVDGDEVASMAADDEDEYLDEDDGSLRFSGLDIVSREDESTTIVIAVTVQNSVDGTNNGEAWVIDATEIRYTDADDVTSTDNLTVDSVSFDIEEEGEGDELAVKSSSEDPDSTTISLSEDDRSDWTTIFAFDLDTDDSDNDIEVNELTVGVDTTGGATFGNVINDLRLVVDGEEYDDWSFATGTTASTSVQVTFDLDGDLVIDAGDRVTAELQVEFKALASTYEGDTVSASTTSSTIDAEGADDLTGSQLTGSASGDTHTLRSEGIIIEFVSSEEELIANDDSSSTDNEAEYTLKFDVTAFESDIYIDKTAATGTTATTTGVTYRFLDSNGAVAHTELNGLSAILTSTADSDGSEFVVDEGETETFTLTVSANPLTAGFYYIQLYGVNVDTSVNQDMEVQQRALPESDFESEAINI